MGDKPDRNLALELVRTTEAAALAAGRWMGRGDRNRADQAAVDAMRLLLNSIEMDGIIVSGEGEKDEAPMLYNGERVGTGDPPEVDIAVDPIDGTRLLALGRPGAIAVVAVAERGTMFDPRHIVYMNKIAVGPEAAGHVDIEAPVADNLRAVARAKGKDINDLTVMILDRPRHEQLIAEVREAGARIRLIPDGDISAALSTAIPDTGVDLLLGIGGAPEAMVSACALKCVGGEIQCKLWPRNQEEVEAAKRVGLSLDQVLRIDDLVQSDNVFFAA
ncbi:MAG: class II fructose-bisphosphatase, partial [Anaerolineae bacterium]|nr:class II fructose-bisphosphatase [Anaerolineae bacterium]